MDITEDEILRFVGEQALRLHRQAQMITQLTQRVQQLTAEARESAAAEAPAEA